LRHMLCNMDIDRFFRDSTYMIIVFELFSSIIQQ